MIVYPSVIKYNTNMSQNKPVSRELSRKSLTGKPIVRDRNYYLQSMDIQDSLLKKAVSIAERMFAAFVRESKVEVSLDADDLADKIIKKIEPRLKSEVRYVHSDSGTPSQPGFDYDDDEPVIIKTKKTEIKGADKIKKTSKSSDSIADNLDALEDFQL